MVPCSVEVKTTSSAIVAAPVSMPFEGAFPDHGAGGGVDAGEAAGGGSDGAAADEAGGRALEAEVVPRDEEDAAGLRHRSQHAAQRAGAVDDRLRRQRPVLVAVVLADSERPDPLAVGGAEGDHLARLAGADDDLGGHAVDPLGDED